MIVVDTSDLLAAVDRHSRLHQETKALLDKERENPATRLLISPFVLAEVDYMLSESKNRPDVAMDVLRDVECEAYRLEPFSAAGVARARRVMERYADQRIGLTDASNVVIAVHHSTLDILTTDERHFRVLRGPVNKPFRLLPMDL